MADLVGVGGLWGGNRQEYKGSREINSAHGTTTAGVWHSNYFCASGVSITSKL